MTNLFKIFTGLFIIIILLSGCSNPDTQKRNDSSSDGDSQFSDIGEGINFSQGQSSLITTVRNASDPSGRLFCHKSFEPKLYVYTTSDLKNTPGNYPINTIYCYTGNKNGTDFDSGSALVTESDFTWAKQNAKHVWAADCIQIGRIQDPTYYLFVPLLDKNYNNVSRVGVAYSNNPNSGFTAYSFYIHGISSSINNGYCSDPGIYKESNSNIYMVYCNGDWNTNPKGWIGIAKLGEPGVGFYYAEDYGELTINSLPSSWPAKGQLYLEAPALFKEIGQYYLIFSAKPNSSQQQVIAYATATNILGPYTYQKVIMNSFDDEWTNHASIINYQSGVFYFFYHYGVNVQKDGYVEHNRKACLKCFDLDYSSGQIPTLTHDGQH